MKLLHKYQNGNATIEIFDDGTRITEWPDNEPLKLEYPLNVDIRLMTKCDFGYNPTTKKSVCGFCHESARTDGEGSRQTLRGEKYLIDVLFGSSYFELGIC